jgi:hypothetical protein
MIPSCPFSFILALLIYKPKLYSFLFLDVTLRSGIKITNHQTVNTKPLIVILEENVNNLSIARFIPVDPMVESIEKSGFYQDAAC